MGLEKQVDYQDKPVVVTNVGDAFSLAFNGPIHTNTAWLEGELKRVIAAKPKTVDLDLSATEHISSLGLGILVHFNQQILAGGGVAKIIKIRKLTLGMLRVSRLDRVLNVDPAAEIVGVPVKP